MSLNVSWCEYSRMFALCSKDESANMREICMMEECHPSPSPLLVWVLCLLLRSRTMEIIRDAVTTRYLICFMFMF